MTILRKFSVQNYTIKSWKKGCFLKKKSYSWNKGDENKENRRFKKNSFFTRISIAGHNMDSITTIKRGLFLVSMVV